MAVSNFLLTMDDLKGDSKEIADAIDVESWSFGLSSPTDAYSRQATGRYQVGDLVISKWIDKSSPLLLEALAENKLFRKVKLQLRHMEGGKSKTYYSLELENARVRSATVKGPGPLAVPTEILNISYQSATCTYVDGGVMGTWDAVSQNT